MAKLSPVLPITKCKYFNGEIYSNIPFNRTDFWRQDKQSRQIKKSCFTLCTLLLWDLEGLSCCMWETVKKQSSSSFAFSNSDLVDLTLWTVQFESTMLKGPHFSQLKIQRNLTASVMTYKNQKSKSRLALAWENLRRIQIKKNRHNAIKRPFKLIEGPNRSFIVKAMIKDRDTHGHP